MKAASSLAMKKTISLGVPMRPNSVRATAAALNSSGCLITISVATMPGCAALTRILSAAYATAPVARAEEKLMMGIPWMYLVVREIPNHAIDGGL